MDPPWWNKGHPGIRMRDPGVSVGVLAERARTSVGVLLHIAINWGVELPALTRDVCIRITE